MKNLLGSRVWGVCGALFLGFFFFCALAIPQAHATPIELIEFVPQGSVKRVTQIRASFKNPIVPFGEQQRDQDPFTLECEWGGNEAVKGKGRFVDPKNWVYEFEKETPSGVVCKIRANEKYVSSLGLKWNAPRAFEFSTGGPMVVGVSPYEGSRLSEQPAWVLSFDIAVDKKAIEQKVYVLSSKTQEKIPVEVLEGKLKERVFKSLDRYSYWYDDSAAKKNRILIQTKRRFPAETEIELVIDSGLLSQAKIPTDEKKTYQYSIRKKFSATASCERENADADCIPFRPVTVIFENEIPKSMAAQIRLKVNGVSVRPRSFRAEDSDIRDVIFPGPFPEKAQLTIELPKGLKDIDGRVLENARAFPLKMKTAPMPPLAKFSANFGILEKTSETLLPVTLRNVEAKVPGKLSMPGKVLRLESSGAIPAQIFSRFTDLISQVETQSYSYEKRVESLAREKWDGWETQSIEVPKPNGAEAFEVVGIPLAQPGLYFIELESARLGKNLTEEGKPVYVSTVALVTDLAVHFKRSRENALVWVTRLSDGKPVEGAQIAVMDCRSEVHATGRTGKDGILMIEKSLPKESGHCSSNYYSPFRSGYTVVASLKDDVGIVHSSWDKGIEPWRYQVQTYDSSTGREGRIVRTILDRSLLRAGETVHMKHIARLRKLRGIEIPKVDSLPKKAKIRHGASDTEIEIDLKWRSDGTAVTDWVIPKDAKLGSYSVELVVGTSDYGNEWTANFRVEEFRVPLMKAELAYPVKTESGNLVLENAELPVQISLSYLNGGGAANAPVTLRSLVRRDSGIQLPGFDEVSFNVGGVTLDRSERQRGKPDDFKSQKLTLDATGGLRAKVSALIPEGDVGSLETQLEYKDPSGQFHTLTRSIQVTRAQALVAIQSRHPHYVKRGTPYEFKVAVADPAGKPLQNHAVEASWIRQVTLTHRKKLVGGFYAYENESRLEPLGQACAGRTDETGWLRCSSNTPVEGSLALEVKAQDSAGRVSKTNLRLWAFDQEEWWFAQEDSDRIDLIPEKKRYEVGEQAVFQVQMPFEKASALIAVEREGVLKAWVENLESKKPLVTVPIEREYAPNLYVSTLVVRGRVGEPKPTALLDLGKPAYKMGLSMIEVGWKPHELKVEVLPEKTTYQVREKAKVAFRVKTADGGAIAKDATLTVAVVDEGLLQLTPNTTWALLKEMMSQRPYLVETSTAQMHVIGKRHFGLKAVASGGGGGRMSARTLFETLLFWKADVALKTSGSEGTAEIEFPMNDSLTSFRVVGVVLSGADRFGTGESRIRSTQEVMLLSGVSPVGRIGDHLDAEFTIRNTSESTKNLKLKLLVGGQAQEEKRLSLTSGASHSAVYPVKIRTPSGKLAYEFEAIDEATGKTVDSMKVDQEILESQTPRVLQATLGQLKKETPVAIPVELPRDADASRSKVQVALTSSLAGDTAEIERQMKLYPYTCLEQQTSRAVILQDEALWKSVNESLPIYLDQYGLAKFFPSARLDRGSDILSGYLLRMSLMSGGKLSAENLSKLREGLKKYVAGQIPEASLFFYPDRPLRRLSAIATLAEYGDLMTPEFESIDFTPNYWPVSALLDYKIVLGKLPNDPARLHKLSQIDQVLSTRVDFQGTTMRFRENFDRMPWNFWSDDLAAIRLTLSQLASKKSPETLARFMRGALGRQRSGSWDMTVANAWGSLLIRKFRVEMEGEKISGETKIALAKLEKKAKWGKEGASPSVLDFSFPKTGAPLSLAHEGGGSPWYRVTSIVSSPLKETLHSGMRLVKTVKKVDGSKSKTWEAGDVIEVKLTLETKAAMSWVVIRDPIPAGASILNVMPGKETSTSSEDEWDWMSGYPIFEERKFDSLRAYYSWFPEGTTTLRYRYRLNQAGNLTLPESRAEAMYDPDLYSEIPNAVVKVGRTK